MNRSPIALLFFVTLAALPVAAKSDDEAKIKSLISNFCDAWKTGSGPEFLATVGDGFHFSNPGGTFDREQTLEQLVASPKSFSNIRFVNMTIVIQGDRFVAEYQYCSTNRSTGKREADGTVAVGEVKDGRIVAWKEYYDPAVGDLQAAGKLVVDEGGPAFPYPRSAPNRW